MKKLFCLFCLILLTNIVFSQVSDWKKPLDSNFAQMYFHPADFIIEGTLTDFYIVKLNGQIFYKLKISLSKVFKGDLKVDKEINIFNLVENKADFEIEKFRESESKRLKEVFLNRKNKSAIYFCKIFNKVDNNSTNLLHYDSFNYLLNYDLKIIDGNSYKYDKVIITNDSSSVVLPYPYKALNKLEEFYDFLAKSGYPMLYDSGEKVERRPDPEPIKISETKINNDSIQKAIKAWVLSDESPIYNKEKLKKINKESKRKNRKNQRQNNYNLNYNIINETYTCSNIIDTYLEFDIEIASNQACYFAQGWVFLNYNTAVFGNNINASGGLIINNGANFPSQYSNYKYDWTPSQIALAINTSVTTASKTFIGSNNSNVLLHVKMKILNRINTTQLSFDEVAMNNTFESFYSIANNSGSWLQFNCFATDVEDHIPVKPIIENITYSKLNLSGGTGTIVTIKGRFFGTDGIVSFPDADKKGPTATLNNNDFLLNGYKDREIKFTLPSIVDYDDPDDAKDDPTPGSGTITIFNECSGSNKSNSITVDYAVLTSDQGSKPRYHEVGFSSAGTSAKTLKFNIDKEVFDNTGAMQCIRTAMKAWSCASGINLELGSITTSTATPKYSNLDGVSTIYYEVDNNPNSNINAATLRDVCSIGPFFKGRDIRIVTNRPWNYSINGTLASSENHFYSTILHEFGHVNNLDHTLNADVMFPVNPTGAKRNPLSQNDINGGNDVMIASLAYNPANACNASTMTAANKTAIGCYITNPSQKM